MFSVIGRGFILLLVLAGLVTVFARTTHGAARQTVEFTSDFLTPFGIARLDGLMTTDGERHRLAIYWIEPRLIRDGVYFINSCDLLFTADTVHYWLPGMLEPSVFRATDGSERLLPRQENVASMVRSALEIAQSVQRRDVSESDTLNLQRFLRESYGQAEYIDEYVPDETNEIDLFNDTVTDREILNALPFGREYRKETLGDGSLKWRLVKALNRQFIGGTIVRRITEIDDTIDSRPFDIETLGQWPRVPQPYRIYWSLRAACSELDASADPNVQSAEMCDRIASYLKTHPQPAKVCRALEYLWVETAFLTDDLVRIRQALQAMATGFCQDETVSLYPALLELAEVADTMEAAYPQQFRATFEPLLAQMVEHRGEDLVESFDLLIRSISANRRFLYGNVLFEVIGRQPMAETAVVRAAMAKYRMTRLALEDRPFDLSRASPAVKRYLAQFENGPVQGNLNLDDIRLILETGLTLPDPNERPDRKALLIEDVLRSLRCVVGEGPFQGDRTKLIEAIRNFSRTYFIVCRNQEPISPALTTFLALSFCDTSTQEDHDVLCEQVRQIGAHLEDQINVLLADWRLDDFVTPEDVSGVAQKYCGQEFRRYVNDPLCPTFKFPLTETETVRLVNKLDLDLDQLPPLFEEISLKVKYGGPSEQLKRATVSGISRIIENLLPKSAFLRRPSYPGSVYQYRGQYGFTGVIPERVYREDNHPEEQFRMMRYFHLGHRIEDVANPNARRNKGVIVSLP